jgi:hypothetical protein
MGNEELLMRTTDPLAIHHFQVSILHYQRLISGLALVTNAVTLAVNAKGFHHPATTNEEISP